MSIELKNITHIYEPGTPFEAAALNNVSLEIREGEKIGLMGRTGCGKSTLIQIMAGLIKPLNGNVIIDGIDIDEEGYDRTGLRQKLGIVFQYPEVQLFETTAYKDVAFGLKYSDLTPEEKDENIRWAFEITGFDPDKVGSKSPLELSGGEKRRLAIAGVLAVRPKYLILDEPIAGLDPVAREKFLKLLRDLNEEGMTIIMISHNADAIAGFADRTIVMSNGRIEIEGDTKTVFMDRPKADEAGISVSTAGRIAGMLRDRGIDVSEDVMSESELLEELCVHFNNDNRSEDQT